MVLKWYECVCVCVCFNVCVCFSVCVCRMNMKYAVHWHIHVSVHSVLCQCYTQEHAHPHPQTIWGQRTDRAKSGYCQLGSWVDRSDRRKTSCTPTTPRLVSAGSLCSVHVHCSHDLKSYVLPPKSVITSDWLATVYKQSTKPWLVKTNLLHTYCRHVTTVGMREDRGVFRTWSTLLVSLLWQQFYCCSPDNSHRPLTASHTLKNKRQAQFSRHILNYQQ